ncbi:MULTISPECIES: MerR family transcriptional regulator [unclassified Streptomyces]|uniref:DNA polymerase III subunit beta family protein n=1 Tax=unclassified Streptomyces TaxID=2593676 RepID=UPI0016612074|nr:MULTISPECIES: MerR family transcriptional regulator [unclassified Streptomyces]MBD0710260.1 transcriptional regulator [Streptomyces sp. CBMA291]MBD0712873.1 transcriptional regulator [Streptomyces sp. CBMA370]
MPNSELMPIGSFARRTGLTSSALRFYADSGLLSPAETDPVSGYRYYSADQVARAVELRRLRRIAMPLSTVETVLDAGPGEASRLIDEHVAKVVREAEAVRRKAALIKSSLADVPSVPVATLKGPVLADAIEQVLTATARDPGLPVLGGVRVEATPEAVTLTATDRYRLATRTLVPAEPTDTTWAATVGGDELRTAVGEVRRSMLVRCEATPDGIRFRTANGEARHCRLLPEEFPDHRLMLASLPEARTRVTVSKRRLLAALEEHPAERIALHVTPEGLRSPTAAREAQHPGFPLPAAVSGEALRISFELPTLHPAVSTAIGPDLMLDLRGPDQPVTVRSADRGDLTTVVMPVAHDRVA